MNPHDLSRPEQRTKILGVLQGIQYEYQEAFIAPLSQLEYIGQRSVWVLACFQRYTLMVGVDFFESGARDLLYG